MEFSAAQEAFLKVFTIANKMAERKIDVGSDFAMMAIYPRVDALLAEMGFTMPAPMAEVVAFLESSGGEGSGESVGA